MSGSTHRLAKFLIKEIENSGLPKEAISEMVEIIQKNFKKYQDLKPSKRQIQMEDILKVVKKKETVDSTDLSLLVSTTEEIASEWDRSKITDALIKESGLERKEATDVAFAVEKKIFSSDMKIITVGLIRELVDNELFERGFKTKLKRQEVLGMSSYNIRELVQSKTNENSNISANNPEAVNLTIAENLLKQYALKEVFSEDVAQAHLKGALHIHDLGYPVRVYCSAHSLEYIKKYGLKLENLDTVSSPARHARTLSGHLNTFLASMQAYYAGALGIGYINIFYAPYLTDLTDKELKQEAQYLIYSCSQNAFSRGGQTLFIDFNVHLGVPEYLKNVPAIGPGGKYTGKTYGFYEKEAQRFARVMMEVWGEGDKEGKPFSFPKLDLHINKDTFSDSKQLLLLKYAAEIASVNGTPYFIFDRDDIVLSACCRLRTQVKDNYVLKHPESLRFCGFQNVTINLPQCAYRAGEPQKVKLEEVTAEIYNTMEKATKAHLQKKKFIKKLMAAPGAPLWEIGKESFDGKPYIDLDREDTSYIMGMIGLNECVQYITGYQLHEDNSAYKLGLQVISAMYLKAKEYEKEYDLSIKLEETPAESTSLRLAKVDLQEYPQSKNYIRGNHSSGEVYYTNSIHLAPDAPVDILERIEKQGAFHNLIEAGAITHIFVGEELPDPETILSLIKKTWENTQTAQLTISPEFTVCEDCHRVSYGYGRKKTDINFEDLQKIKKQEEEKTAIPGRMGRE